ncbi:MAG TPA: GGDEF domain-containing protein [Herminiimonas sp.]|nr:GGDEF domain-containing protein [Herminiimonas sp.]
MVESLLDHLVEITGHRDHDLLDISVMTALLNMVGVNEARVLELFQFRGDLFVRPRVWITDGKVSKVNEENFITEQTGEPLVNYPGLVACIAQRKNRMEESSADGRHTMWMPIWQNDKVSTCIEISNNMPFTTQMLHVVEGILSVYRNYQSLLDYSERDSLTGLLNRKTFDEKFSRMVTVKPPDNPAPGHEAERRHQTDEKSQWLAVVDIDHFKRVNDTFGHLYGDEVLILVANILRTSFRSHDRVFRFGGEEFVILLRSTTLDNARMIFERFRTNVENYAFPQVGQVTVSIGFASIAQETPVVILGHADQALYHAKENGRNRVCYYDELRDQGMIQQISRESESVEFFFDEPAAN